MSTTTVVHVGEYAFTITDSILYARGEVFSRTFKIGGKKLDYVSIGIHYRNGDPIYAKMSYAEASGDCSSSKPLLRGKEGTVIMVQTLLRHIHEKLPTLTSVRFEDMSSIQCDLSKDGIAKMPLYYYSIIYHDKTWYERYYQARLLDRRHPSEDGKDPEPHIPFHEHYERAKKFLVDPAVKSDAPFDTWKMPEELRERYERAPHYRAFFESIPKDDRCRLMGSWIHGFMETYMAPHFSNMDWEIDIPTFLRHQGLKGGRHTMTRRMKRGKKRHNRTRCAYSFPPFILHGGDNGQVMGTVYDVE